MNQARRADTGYQYNPKPYQNVWEADFSGLTTPGEYRVRVPGLGTSRPFRIDEGAAMALARAYALGLYHQRCGTSNELPYTRFVHGPCHTAPAAVPDRSLAGAEHFLSEATANSSLVQALTTPPLNNFDAGFYPFANFVDEPAGVRQKFYRIMPDPAAPSED